MVQISTYSGTCMEAQAAACNALRIRMILCLRASHPLCIHKCGESFLRKLLLRSYFRFALKPSPCYSAPEITSMGASTSSIPDDCVILITGASRGIGKVVQHFAAILFCIILYSLFVTRYAGNILNRFVERVTYLPAQPVAHMCSLIQH